MKVLCVTWPVNLIKCHYHQSKYVYGGRNACRPGRICLLVLLSNFGECALTRQGQSLTRMSTAGKAVKERNCTQMPVTKKERTDHKCLWQRNKEQTTNGGGKRKNGCPNQASKQLTPNERNKTAEPTSKNQKVAYLQA